MTKQRWYSFLSKEHFNITSIKKKRKKKEEERSDSGEEVLHEVIVDADEHFSRSLKIIFHKVNFSRIHFSRYERIQINLIRRWNLSICLLFINYKTLLIYSLILILMRQQWEQMKERCQHREQFYSLLINLKKPYHRIR